MEHKEVMEVMRRAPWWKESRTVMWSLRLLHRLRAAASESATVHWIRASRQALQRQRWAASSLFAIGCVVTFAALVILSPEIRGLHAIGVRLGVLLLGGSCLVAYVRHHQKPPGKPR